MAGNYDEFLASKNRVREFESCPNAGELAPHLFAHQAVLVGWALKRGRAAMFVDTGLGKTAIELEWARHVSTVGRVLILAPLAVAEQTVREARRFGAECGYARRPGDTESRVVITNYDLLEHFIGERWAGVVLDESSILKAYDGKTRNAIINGFGGVPYKLACTATPAPNDFTELGNHSEFLGVELATELVAGIAPAIVWCELNDEADACEAAIDGAVQVKGSQDHFVKSRLLQDFANGEARVLVSKPSVCGWGLNWQHCARMVFVGASHSYEQTYQAVRRCWRFGQVRPVQAHIIRAETEGAIVANYRRKEADAERLSQQMVALMRESMADFTRTAKRETNAYNPQTPMRVPCWLTEENAA